jgi:hypothetical protein
MKKSIFFLLLTTLFTNVFAQKTIENPEYGLCTVPGSLTKIELLDDATVLHFHIKHYTNSAISVSKKSYIQARGSEEKLFVNKAVGVEIGGENNKTSDYGELFYSLYFPKLDTNIKAINFGEIKTDEAAYDTGFIDHILIDEDSPMLPKALRGDWLLIDGSNR